MLTLWLVAALVSPSPPLARAAAAVRVGDAEAAEAALGEVAPGEVAPGGDDALVAGLLRAQARIVRGDGVGALAILDGLPAEPAVDPVAGLLVLRAAGLLPAADPGRLARLGQAAGRLGTRDLPDAVDLELKLRVAESQLQGAPESRRLAVETLRSLAQDQRDPTVPPEALGLLLDALEGDARRAVARRLLLEYGETEAGRRAMAVLPPESLAHEDRRTRARRLFVARAYDPAEAELARLLADPAASAETRQWAHLTIGVIRVRLREGYEAAAEHLKQAAAGPDRERADEAWFRLGVALGQLERWDEAVAAMRTYLKRAPGGGFATAAGYQVGRLYHEAGRYPEAIAALEDFLRVRRPDHVKYQWFLGWAHFRKGDCPAARKVWADIAPRANQLEGAKALYWTARCQLDEGDREAARATLAELARRAPLGYYGLLGAALGAQTFGGDALPPRPAGWPLALREAGPATTGTGPADRRVRLLAQAGFPHLARRRASEGTAADYLLELYGPRWQSQAARRLPWNEGLARQPESVIRASLPPAYLDLARAAGRLHDVSPWWLIAHMLQESRFRERFASHAGALGTMQILPRTGRIIAERVGFPRGRFFGEHLYDPGVALRHAAWYLAALREDLGGHPMLAMAAYNGGPRRVAEHLARHRDLPFDVMVEEMGAHETRNYLRKVTDHLVRYVTLYAPDEERRAVLESLLPPARVPQARGKIDF